MPTTLDNPPACVLTQAFMHAVFPPGSRYGKPQAVYYSVAYIETLPYPPTESHMYLGTLPS